MANINHKRKEKKYFIHVSEIVSNELTNSNISFSTVTEVKLSNDSSWLDIFVNIKSNESKTLEALNNSKGFIRSRLSTMAGQRIVPNIRFKKDVTFEHALKIEKIINKIKNEDN
ncbi:MAG: 30S ribosome-binding factor RbfA [Mollicutes bacterium PWAP]|nr:30S ribosome-binding factor RbfA [Mollicutes bacterium PWAP]